MGRAFSLMMSQNWFSNAARKVNTAHLFLKLMDSFMTRCTMLPPPDPLADNPFQFQSVRGGGCCGGGGDEVKHVKPQDTNVNDYDHVYRMDIEGMHCKNCAMRIENAFNEQPDCMAKVDLAGKFVRIYTKKPVEEVVLKQTVWRAGYEPKTVTVEK